jgi:hypothetical protein
MESNRVDDLSACPKTLRYTSVISVRHSDEFGPQLRSALYQLKYRGPVLLQVERQGETALCRFLHAVNLLPRLGTIRLPTARVNRHAHLAHSESQLPP